MLDSISPPLRGVQSTKGLGATSAAQSAAVDRSDGRGGVSSLLSPNSTAVDVAQSAQGIVVQTAKPQTVSVTTVTRQAGTQSLQSPTETPDSKPAVDLSGAEQEQKVEQETQQVLMQLRARDREVRAHEQAHAIAGGVHAGAPEYQMQVGPDGVSYAVGGSVDVDLSPVAGDPEATVDKMEKIKAAALAPAQPSSQDLKVAAQASQLAQQARLDMLEEKNEEPIEALSNTEGALNSGERLAVLAGGSVDEGAVQQSAEQEGSVLNQGQQDNQQDKKDDKDEEDALGNKNAAEEFENIKPEGKVIKQYLAVYEGIAQISDVLVASQIDAQTTQNVLSDLVNVTV